MRKIKFRAWDKIAGIMRYDLNEYNMSLLTNSVSVQKFMLFTGLRDKNGNDIYEGDIITYTISGTNRKVWKNEIIWQDGCLIIENEDVPPITNEDLYDIEIIGNICENPELKA